MVYRSLVLLLVAVVIASGFYVVTQVLYAPSVTDDGVNTPSPAESVNTEIVGFRWDTSSTRHEGEIPNTDVYVVLRYANGTEYRALLNTIVGYCNVDVMETQLALGSEQITCYYAGLGHKFRVIETIDAYLVQQRISEEALPTNEGEPMSEFETKLVFSKR